MRPKKTILLVDEDEEQLGIRRFLLETYQYRVYTAKPKGALTWLAEVGPGNFDLVLWELEKGDRDGAGIVPAVRRSQPEARVLMTSRRMSVYPAGMRADCFLTRDHCGAAELLEFVRTMVARKRGPKKKPVASVTAADAFAIGRLA